MAKLPAGCRKSYNFCNAWVKVAETLPLAAKSCELFLSSAAKDFFAVSLQQDFLLVREIPCEWKYANITALYKKGDKKYAGNYRPVSLTSVVCKVLESIIRENIVEHMK